MPVANTSLERFILLLAVVLGVSTPSLAQDKKINFPEVDGFKILVCDPHIHTVFSDGGVWPTIRVEEGIREGLDVVSITDHLEYQPHKEDIPHLNRNRGYELAKAFAKDNQILVINGSEVTRSMPPGHVNAIYLQDANLLLKEDPVEVIREAARQGAFIFWDHPSWPTQAEDGGVILTDMHQQLLKEGLIHGIEVINGNNYYEDAVDLALKHNLAMLGSSDVHGLTEWDYQLSRGNHRPVTLILSKEKTEAAVKEALFARRTIAWHNSLLVGPEKYVSPLLKSMIKISSARYQGNVKMGEATIMTLVLENNSDVEITLENASQYSFQQSLETVVLPARTQTTIFVKTLKKLQRIEIPFEVKSAVIGPKKHPVLKLVATVTE
jgi:hypothetical protein